MLRCQRKPFHLLCQAAAETPSDGRNVDCLVREPQVVGDKDVSRMNPGAQPASGVEGGRNEQELKQEFKTLARH